MQASNRVSGLGLANKFPRAIAPLWLIDWELSLRDPPVCKSTNQSVEGTIQRGESRTPQPQHQRPSTHYSELISTQKAKPCKW